MTTKEGAVRKLRFGIHTKLIAAITLPLILAISIITVVNLNEFVKDKMKYVFYVIHLSTTQACGDVKDKASNDPKLDEAGFTELMKKKYQDLEFSNNYLFADAKGKRLWGDNAPLLQEPTFKSWLSSAFKRNVEETTSEESWGEERYVVSTCKMEIKGHTYLSAHVIPKSRALESVWALANSIVVVAIFVLAISFWIAIFLARGFSRPIHVLADASDEIAAGNFHHNWKIGNRDEIGLLSDHLTILKDRLQKREIELSKVSKIANMDHLTGIWNRRFLEQNLEMCLGLAARGNRPICGVYFDLDHFKKINDTYGHEAGDIVLKKVGELLRKSVRKTDLAARMGGEEFFVILQETPLEGALTFAHKFRELLKSQPLYIHTDGTKVNVTASIGIVARFEDNVNTVKDFIAAADAFAYQSKKGGRDRIHYKLGMVA